MRAITILVIFLLAAVAWSQQESESLGDLARKAREQNKQAAPAKKVLTNDGISDNAEPASDSTPATPGEASDSVTGSFAVYGKSVKLSHVYAVPDEGCFVHGIECINLLLSDVPLSVDALSAYFREDFSPLIKMVKKGKLHAVALRLDRNKQLVDSDLYDPAFPAGWAKTAVASPDGVRFSPNVFD